MYVCLISDESMGLGRVMGVGGGGGLVSVAGERVFLGDSSIFFSIMYLIIITTIIIL